MLQSPLKCNTRLKSRQIMICWNSCQKLPSFHMLSTPSILYATAKDCNCRFPVQDSSDPYLGGALAGKQNRLYCLGQNSAAGRKMVTCVPY